jgi:hypothetical protein
MKMKITVKMKVIRAVTMETSILTLTRNLKLSRSSRNLRTRVSWVSNSCKELSKPAKKWPKNRQRC